MTEGLPVGIPDQVGLAELPLGSGTWLQPFQHGSYSITPSLSGQLSLGVTLLNVCKKTSTSMLTFSTTVRRSNVVRLKVKGSKKKVLSLSEVWGSVLRWR